jgi:hypothetical protein
MQGEQHAIFNPVFSGYPNSNHHFDCAFNLMGGGQ